MSIRTGIVADNPIAYWPLDDPFGNVIADFTGNGHTGYPIGSVAFSQPGPEAGTTCILEQASGGVVSNAGTPVLAVPMSMVCWLSAEQLEVNNTIAFYDGLSNARGAGYTWQVVGNGEGLGELRGGILQGGANGAVNVASWHQWAITYTAASLVSVYLDGALVVAAAAHVWNPCNAGDPFLIGGPGSTNVYAAHFALWGIALTGAQIAAQFAANSGIVTPSPSSSPTGADLAAQLELLNKIWDAVHKVY